MDVEQYLERPKQYYNIDGVEWPQMRSPQGSHWRGMPTFLTFMLFVGSILHYGSKAIKSRLTYPRTGFVAYRQVGNWPWLAAAVVAFRGRGSIMIPALLMGLVTAASHGYGFARLERRKWIVTIPAGLAALGMTAWDGWVTRIVAPRATESLLLCPVCCGAVLLASGGISLALHLHRTQAPE